MTSQTFSSSRNVRRRLPARLDKVVEEAAHATGETRKAFQTTYDEDDYIDKRLKPLRQSSLEQEYQRKEKKKRRRILNHYKACFADDKTRTMRDYDEALLPDYSALNNIGNQTMIA